MSRSSLFLQVLRQCCCNRRLCRCAGCCFLFGGFNYQLQEFNSIANRVSNSLLFLAVIGLILPTVMPMLPNMSFNEDATLHFSRVIAVLLLVTYIVYLYFQLVSHHTYFLPAAEAAEGGDGAEPEEAEELEKPALTVTAELGALLAISLVVAVASECGLPLGYCWWVGGVLC